jgi:4-hydroxybenzoate polyprenyltransferase
LFVTLLLSLSAATFAGYGNLSYTILIAFFLLCSTPAVLFIFKKTPQISKSIELMSALWTIVMYLTLGGVPMLRQLFFL